MDHEMSGKGAGAHSWIGANCAPADEGGTQMSYSRRSMFAVGAALASAALLPSRLARAVVSGKDIDYRDGDADLQGFLAVDEAVTDKRPGILVMHTRRGLGDFIKERSEALAHMGYVVFAADFFGKGVRPVADKDAQVQSVKYREDRVLARSRAQAGLDWLRQHPLVDTDKIGVVGYCLGGMVALELARSGAPLSGTAVFHGTLDTPNPHDAINIKGRVLVMHGADDPVANQQEVEAFIGEMRVAKVDFELELYGGVVHGFTETKNGNDPSRGSAYNARADKASWASMQRFFHEVFPG
jgi:dienelactone hydrolase